MHAHGSICFTACLCCGCVTPDNPQTSLVSCLKYSQLVMESFFRALKFINKIPQVSDVLSHG